MGCRVYENTHQDNIINTSDSWDAHLNHICDILQRLRFANLTAKAYKTKFVRENTKYLEHVVGNGKIAPKPHKVNAFENFPACTS